MQTKVLEIRDAGTFIPALAVKLESENEEQAYLMARVGFSRGNNSILLVRLSDQESTADLYEWGSSTMMSAHQYIEQHFDDLRDGDVVDIEFIRGVRAEKKISERFTA